MSDPPHQNPFISQTNDPATPRPVMTNEPDDIFDAPLRPAMPDHDDGMRQAAPGREWAETSIEHEPFDEPNEQPRPFANEHGHVIRPTAPKHGDEDNSDPVVESAPSDEQQRPVMPVEQNELEEIEEEERALGESEVIAPAPETLAPKAPPEHADLVTVGEAVEIFRKRGLPRVMRTIQKYCSRQTGRVLVSYQIPTENGIRYMIERSSIDRFIDDAAHQAPTGKLENEPVVDPVDREPAMPTVDQGEIFDHPVVQRLEARIEKLESHNEQLQGRIETVLIGANNNLIELQKANAVAQSKSLGAYLLESARIRQQDSDPAPVNREGEHSDGIDV